ncbi:MAG: DUF6770 family protein [Cyclobacteriaceae bacterium]|jgi:hypothetical protein
MKKVLILAFVLSCTLATIAQTRSKENVKTVKIRDSGAIIQNGIVKGYFNFLDLEKKDRKNNNYELSITDENLREIGSVTITRPNTYLVVDAVFNGESFGFLFYDIRSRSVELISYDKNLKEGGKVIIELENKYAAAMYVYMAQGHEPMQAFLKAVPNKGFVYYGIKEETKSDFEIIFFDNSMKKVWSKSAPKDDFDFENANEAYQDEQFVGSMVVKRTGVMDLNPDFDLLMQSVTDGSTVFRIPLTTAKYKVALAEISFDKTKQQFIVFGEYYDKSDNILKDDSRGFISQVLDLKGKIVSEKTNTWSDITAKIATKDKEKFEKTAILFHDFITTNDGHIFAIGEQYKRGGTPLTPKLNVFNMVIFEFDANYAITKTYFFEKDKNGTDLPQGSLIMSSKLLSYIAKSYGGFDYIFTQPSKDNQTFVVNYINYDREKGQKGKNQLGSIIYTPEKSFTVDKIDLNNKGKKYFVYQAKQGYVMIAEYDEKQKKIDSRLEKINY